MEHEKKNALKKIELKEERLRQRLAELLSLYHARTTKPQVSFYEGEKGMREAYEDTLTSKGEILAYANVETVHEGIPNFFPEYYLRRAKAKIAIQAIFPKK